MENFWAWAKTDNNKGLGGMYLGNNRYINFDKDIWFKLRNSMLMKHWSNFQYHVKHIHSDIIKPFMVVILYFSERVREIHDLDKYVPPPLMKGRDFYQSDWTIRDK